MEIGGEVRVSISHIELSRSEMDSVIRDLHTDLGNSSANRIVVDTVDAADPRAGRKLFEYMRDEQGVFSFSNVRTSFAQSGISTSLESSAVGNAGGSPVAMTAQSLEDTAAARAANLTARTAEKDLAETASTALMSSATNVANRRLSKAVVPVVGALFAIPDALKGFQDLAHGEFIMGLGTLGVAIIDVVSQGLHATDEITAGGGTVLAITIQTWAATMQFAFESARISRRATEFKAYMRAHSNNLPPRDELMSYYKLSDEDILLLENDIYKAQTDKITTEDMAKQVRSLLTQIDANVNKPLPEGVTPAGIQRERAELSKLLVALEAMAERKRVQAVRERVLSDEKRRQANFDRAQQQQKLSSTTYATPQLLPGPDASQRQPQKLIGSTDPFNLFSPSSMQLLNGISMDNAEIVATGFGRMRDALLARYVRLESEHFPSEIVKSYQSDVAAYLSDLDRMIAEFKRKGSTEWPGVKEMERLKDAANNVDRSKLMR